MSPTYDPTEHEDERPSMDRHYFADAVPAPDKGAHPNGRKPGECYLCGHVEDHPVHLRKRAHGLDPLMELAMQEQLGYVPGRDPTPNPGRKLTLEDFKAAAAALPKHDPELDFVAIRANPASLDELRNHPAVAVATGSGLFALSGLELLRDPGLPRGVFARMNRAQLKAWREGRFVDQRHEGGVRSFYGDELPGPGRCPRCRGEFGVHEKGCALGEFERS